MLSEAKSRYAGRTVLKKIPAGKSKFSFNVGKQKSLTLVLVAKKSSKASVRIRLTGRGASAKIIGIVVGADEEKIMLHTMQVHEAPETTSDLLVKSVLSGHAKCLYDGGIRVEKNAQKTDAYQRNENLLLSPKAYSESKPSLEILANDVRCTHGATAGPIDPEQLWYLATRGITKTHGENLITEGFINSALERVGDKRIIEKVWQTL